MFQYPRGILSSNLSRQLTLLHSYVLVKTLVKLGDHE